VTVYTFKVMTVEYGVESFSEMFMFGLEFRNVRIFSGWSIPM
jgi:hypothetical protein